MCLCVKELTLMFRSRMGPVPVAVSILIATCASIVSLTHDQYHKYAHPVNGII
jgi:hypothetical protein